MLRTLLAGIGVVAIVATTAVAGHAYVWEDGDGRRSVAVDHRGLDLTTLEGQRLLEDRVAHAVRQVCDSDTSSVLSYYNGGRDRDCEDEAWAGARPQIEFAVNRDLRRAEWAMRRDERRAHMAWRERREEQAYAPAYAEPQPSPAPRPEPAFAPAPGPVKRAAIEAATWHAFQSGQTVAWRDGPRHGRVLVSTPRSFGRNVCRNVSVIVDLPDGWAPLADKTTCLARDGLLHDSHGRA